ncbi:homocysteine biosynthesis protein [Dehalogenimonas sp. 4OHTPN]|uniref:Homocysteine biosynthesis protein n=1 Tax=Dehalogenimonas sp. 4OHTPN TaxID=3166643 RepID=A0AAU8G8G9_9CHLR
MAKTIEEINQKIRSGRAVVFTAEEIIGVVKEHGLKKTAALVDVVTTGTFGPMCSSGAYFNIGHTKPRIKLGGGKVSLNDVPAYAGFAAVDVMLGANALPEDDPRNRFHPGEFNYGGGHVIEELVAGKDIKLTATAYGTDCYPRKKLETWINLRDMNEAVLFNMRNAYQNYNVAVNLSDKTIYTYMGTLKANMGNATYCSAGQLSPLLNDPMYKTIGIGTKIFLGGGEGFIAWHGTQFNPSVPRTESGVPKRGAGTLAVIGDLKHMSSRYLMGTSMLGYGVTVSVGIGVPIPILDEDILRHTTVTDDDIFAAVVDYSDAYPNVKPEVVGEISYGELKTGRVKINGREVPTASLSSYPRAREIAIILKDRITNGKFELTSPVATLPGIESGVKFKLLNERPINGEK